MERTKQIDGNGVVAVGDPDGMDLLGRLVERPAAASGVDRAATVVGELVAITDEGRTPLVLYPRQSGTAAIAARTIIELHGAHIGRRVVLMFEDADPARPIVMGVIRGDGGWPLEERPGSVAVDADGERLIVSARQELVLQCGKASITLTRAGKVLIEGEYVSSRSTGVNRVTGGSIHLN